MAEEISLGPGLCSLQGGANAVKVKLLFLPVSTWLFLVFVLIWGAETSYLESGILIKVFWFVYNFYITVSMGEQRLSIPISSFC